MRNNIEWIVRLWKPYPHMVGILLGLTLLNASATILVPLALRRALDELTASVAPISAWSLALLAGVGGLRALAGAALQSLRSVMNGRMERDIRGRVVASMWRKGPSFTAEHGVGDLMTRLVDDLGEDMKLSWFLCSGIFRAFEASIVLVAGTAACLMLDPGLAMACLAPLPVLLVLFLGVTGGLPRRFDELQESIGRVQTQLESSLVGIRMVKAFGLEDRRIATFREAVDSRARSQYRATAGEIGLHALYEYGWQAVVSVVLFAGGLGVIRGELSLGTFAAFNAFAVSLTMPVFDLGTLVTRGRQAMVCIERLRRVEAFPPDVTDGPGAIPAGSSLAGLAVGHRGRTAGTSTLSALSFHLPAGSMVAVVGPTGCGKSTLLRLLLRLVDPTEGVIVRGGVELPRMTLAQARAGIGYLPQDPAVLAGTVAANVRFGRDGIGDAQVRRALALAGLEDDVAALPSGIETLIGPGGVRLSGGQMQRLGLARALAGDPTVLLLDDPTAHLDAATEARVLRSLEELPATTRIMVTSRPRVMARADSVWVLDIRGRLVQAGPHEELLAMGGMYLQLVDGPAEPVVLPGTAAA